MDKILIISLILFPVSLISQQSTFHISGKIVGESKNRIFLFYDNDVAHKDSIYAEIKNGRFSFTQKAVLPVLCRFHFGQKPACRRFILIMLKLP